MCDEDLSIDKTKFKILMQTNQTDTDLVPKIFKLIQTKNYYTNIKVVQLL